MDPSEVQVDKAMGDQVHHTVDLGKVKATLEEERVAEEEEMGLGFYTLATNPNRQLV